MGAAAATPAAPPKPTGFGAKATLDEYLQVQDPGEVVACIKSWEGSAAVLDEFLDILLNKLVDCGESQRVLLLDLIPHLGRGVTPTVTAEHAFGRMFSVLDDVLIDAPLADTHLAAAAARSMATGVCTCAIFAQPTFAAVPKKEEWLCRVVAAAVGHTPDAAFLGAFAAQLKAIWPQVQPLVGDAAAAALIPKLQAALPELAL